jgi:preprotein translocase subunit SecD
MKGEKMKITIMIAVALTYAVQASAAANLELRRTHDAPREEFDRMEIQHNDQGDTIKEMLFVDRRTLVNQNQIKSAELAVASDGTPRIELILTDAASPGLERTLRHDSGDSVAVLLDGQAVAAGEIVREKKAGQIDLSGSFTKREAQQVVDRINQAIRQP